MSTFFYFTGQKPMQSSAAQRRHTDTTSLQKGVCSSANSGAGGYRLAVETFGNADEGAFAVGPGGYAGQRRCLEYFSEFVTADIIAQQTAAVEDFEHLGIDFALGAQLSFESGGVARAVADDGFRLRDGDAAFELARIGQPITVSGTIAASDLREDVFAPCVNHTGSLHGFVINAVKDKLHSASLDQLLQIQFGFHSNMIY